MTELEFDLELELEPLQGSTPPPLREHQSRASEAILSAFRSNVRRVCAVAPTGAGKSRLGRAIADGHSAPLVVSHTTGLRDQNRQTICPRSVTVHSLVAAARKHGLKGTRAMTGPVDLLVLDEAHHYASDNWGVVHELWPQARVLGLTATPERGDGRPLQPYFEQLIKVANYSELLEAGYLVPCRVVRELGGGDERGGRVGRGSRASAVDAYTALCALDELQTLIFAENKSHGVEITNDLVDRGHRAAFICGTTPSAERDATIARFERGELSCLVNVEVLVEGIDIPCVEAIILWKSAGTVGAYLQMAGRGLRPYPGKEELLLVDLSGASTQFGPPDQDRDYSLSGRAISQDDKRYHLVCSACWRGYAVQGQVPDGDDGLPDLSVMRQAPGGAWGASEGGAGASVFRSFLVADEHVQLAAKCGAARVAEIEREYASGTWYGTKAELKQRIRAAESRGTKLAAFLGDKVWTWSGGEEDPTNPCPHCAKERPRGKRSGEYDTDKKRQSGKPDVMQLFRKEMLKLFRRGGDLSQAVPRVLKRLKRTWPEVKIQAATGATMMADETLLEAQRELVDQGIADGWRPGARWHKLTCHLEAAEAHPKAIELAREAARK